MAKRIAVIGIGGTGAKVVEAFLHACAAGLGPSGKDSVWVGFIDQDPNNGNVTRALELRKDIAEVRKQLSRYDFTDSHLWRTNLVGDGEDNGRLWTPFNIADTTFEKAVSPDAKTAPVLRALYSPAELATKLDRGYRGRPSIGSTVLHLAAEDAIKAKHPFWQGLSAALSGPPQDQVQVLLIGSLFGGTGAAGLPTVAEIIRKNFPRAKIGAVLMLPYFTFSPPPEDDGSFADSRFFQGQTSAALRYYHAEMSRENPIFDVAYMVGDEPQTHLPDLPGGEFADGSSLQWNPPLRAELFGGLAGVHFLSAPLPERAGVRVVKRHDRSSFLWKDLPANGSEESADRLASAYLFATWLHYDLRPVLRVSKAFWGLRTVYPAKVVCKTIDPKTVVEAGPMLDAIDTYCRKLLSWFSTMAYFSNPESEQLVSWRRLVDTKQLSGNGVFELKPDVALNRDVQLLVGDCIDPDVHAKLNSIELRGTSPTFADLMAALHRACTVEVTP